MILLLLSAVDFFFGMVSNLRRSEARTRTATKKGAVTLLLDQLLHKLKGHMILAP
jgi:hypothetical protein